MGRVENGWKRERAEWEEGKMGEQGRELGTGRSSQTRELELGGGKKEVGGKNLGGRGRKRMGCGPAGGHASPHS